MTHMNLLEAMEQRHAIRSYTDEPVSEGVLEILRAEVRACNMESGLHFQMVSGLDDAFLGLNTHYGRFTGVHNAIAFIGRPQAPAESGAADESARASDAETTKARICSSTIAHAKSAVAPAPAPAADEAGTAVTDAAAPETTADADDTMTAEIPVVKPNVRDVADSAAHTIETVSADDATASADGTANADAPDNAPAAGWVKKDAEDRPAEDPAEIALQEKVGFYGEHLALRAVQLGLDTGWAVLDDAGTAADAWWCLHPGEKIVWVLAFGHAARPAGRRRTKPMEELCEIPEGMEMPEWFRAGMEAAMLAPTSLSQQPFRFVLHRDGTVGAEVTEGLFAHVGLGCAKCHFEIGAGRDNVTWRE